MADALVSGTSESNLLQVQILLTAPPLESTSLCNLCFLLKTQSVALLLGFLVSPLKHSFYGGPYILNLKDLNPRLN